MSGQTVESVMTWQSWCQEPCVIVSPCQWWGLNLDIAELRMGIRGFPHWLGSQSGQVDYILKFSLVCNNANVTVAQCVKFSCLVCLLVDRHLAQGSVEQWRKSPWGTWLICSSMTNFWPSWLRGQEPNLAFKVHVLVLNWLTQSVCVVYSWSFDLL